MTLRRVGGALGVALLGSPPAQGYSDRIDTVDLRAATEGARDLLAAALAVAVRLGEPALAASARAGYVHGMAIVLYATAAIALLGAVLAAVLLSGRPTARTAVDNKEPDPSLR